MSAQQTFRVGDRARIVKRVRRPDHREDLRPGTEVMVTHVFEFQFQGRTLQDLTIQRIPSGPAISLLGSPQLITPLPKC
jgi:hypothetical protein